MFKIKEYKSISDREDQTTKWWDKNNTFEKSIKERPEDRHYSFLDGPPFVTGLPHYGSLLPRIAKDVIPRYQTMKGKRVRRIWGWDCHGLPIEEKVEKKIGLKQRRDIEKFGINKFLKECKTYVEETSSEWKWYVDKIGEWIDFKNSYKTMDLKYMESVIWVFKKLYDKGLIYEGVKTLLYCTRCGTPVSKFEIAMDDSYADMKDPAITVEFPITSTGEFNGFELLAWTTTPWTMPSNRALVVDPDEIYVQFEGNIKGTFYIAAKKRMKEIMGKDKYRIVNQFKGKKLLGLEYKAPYDYFPPNKNDFKIYSYKGMVNMDEGTGVVHNAAGFGEIDTEMAKDVGLTMMFSVDDEGKFIREVKDFAGLYVKKADPLIIKDLEEKDRLFKSETITHRYPYCYRCQTPLIQKAQKGWFIKIQDFKNLLIKQNKNINWIPPKLTKRFKNTIRTAPDWNVSRTRYWATAMPIWRCNKCNEIEVFGSIKEIEDRSKQKVYDLHRDGVDHITFKCNKCNGLMKRIPEVVDCWMESGSMPYGQIHYPFENKDLFKNTFPADYIIEYIAQTRAWFYYMHVVSNTLLNKNSFKNVVVTGVIWGTDGRKMSKLFKNFPDPKETLIKFGGDALRLYFMSSPIMLGEDMNFNEEDLRNQVSTIIFPLWNSYKYFVTYTNLSSFKPDINKYPLSKNKLDKWILARLKSFQNEIGTNLDRYYIPNATRAIFPFINDLSTWYIRRSRNRFVEKDKNALETLYYTLVQITKIIAPIIPFITEEIYQGLVKDLFKKEPESVHLCLYPNKNKIIQEEEILLKDMEIVRTISSLGQAARVESHTRIRQPLSKIEIKGINIKPWMKDIIKDELNIKEICIVKDIRKKKYVNIQKNKEIKIALCTDITAELKQEGLVREIARQIQDTRKKLGFKINNLVSCVIETDNKNLIDAIHKWNKEICSQTNCKVIKLGKGKKEVNINQEKVKINIINCSK